MCDKGKGDALECGFYRGIKLLEHVMKILEKIVESKVRDIVKMICSLGLWQERALLMPSSLCFSFKRSIWQRKRIYGWLLLISKKLSTEFLVVLWCTLWYLKVDEWIISVIRSMHEDATTLVMLSVGVSNGFNVKVGVHQGSVLGPLLFVIVLEALSRNFNVGLPMELILG